MATLLAKMGKNSAAPNIEISGVDSEIDHHVEAEGSKNWGNLSYL
jgi:hypothetical protein